MILNGKGWGKWFGLVWFYGILTIVGYLMLNPLYTYIEYIYIYVIWKPIL